MNKLQVILLASALSAGGAGLALAQVGGVDGSAGTQSGPKAGTTGSTNPKASSKTNDADAGLKANARTKANANANAKSKKPKGESPMTSPSNVNR